MRKYTSAGGAVGSDESAGLIFDFIRAEGDEAVVAVLLPAIYGAKGALLSSTDFKFVSGVGVDAVRGLGLTEKVGVFGVCVGPRIGAWDVLFHNDVTVEGGVGVEEMLGGPRWGLG